MSMVNLENCKKIIGDTEISLSLTRIAYQIIEDNYPLDENLVLIGIKTGGGFIARRLHGLIKDITGIDLKMGFIDIIFFEFKSIISIKKVKNFLRGGIFNV